jgi:CHAD domain-containing protein
MLDMKEMEHHSPEVGCRERFLAYARTQLDCIQTNFAPASVFCQIEAIHDMRVGLKRVAVVYSLLAWMDPDFEAVRFRTHFGRLFRAAGKVRNLQVVQSLIQDFSRNNSNNLSEYWNYLKIREIKMCQKFKSLCNAFDVHTFTEAESEIAASLNGLNDSLLVFHTGRKIASLLNDIAEIMKSSQSRDSDLHAVRILTKTTRYTIEILQTQFPDHTELQQMNAALKNLHQALGLWHDRQVAVEALHYFLSHEAQTPLFEISAYNRFRNKMTKQHHQALLDFESGWKDSQEILRPKALALIS